MKRLLCFLYLVAVLLSWNTPSFARQSILAGSAQLSQDGSLNGVDLTGASTVLVGVGGGPELDIFTNNPSPFVGVTAVADTANDAGLATFNVSSTVDGDMGATTTHVLHLITVNDGPTVNFLGSVYSTMMNVGVAAVNFMGGASATNTVATNFTGDGTISLAPNTLVTGALTTNTDNTGTLALGSGTQFTGQVGAGAAKLKSINVIGGSNTAGVSAHITGAVFTNAFSLLTNTLNINGAMTLANNVAINTTLASASVYGHIVPTGAANYASALKVNEELKSANEESLSSNEEFQSTNEELETAKEELQATNEETSTLNDDLHNRNVELNRVNSDLVNLMKSVDVPTVILGKDHSIHRLTYAAENVLNMSPADIGRSIHALKFTHSELDLKNLINSVLDTQVPQHREIQNLKDHWYNLRIQVYKTLDDVIDGVVLSFSDIQTAKEHQAIAAAWTTDLEMRVKERTEELAKSQNALVQSEKLEAVGRLAGGVAHDFNNLMTGILGMTQDVRKRLGTNSPHRDDLGEVINAAKKAMAVTKQLLAFGRRQVIDPHVLNINTVIKGMNSLLQKLLGEDITLISILDPRLGNVTIDQSSIEQVILNLGLNARDSMPKGGKITLQTTNTEISNENGTFHLRMTPGPYVALTVTDKGSGMSPETLSHIFEPFFTTKGEGKGTGLGLATIYGIVKQSGGGISVSSTLGQGTSFTIYLPRLGTLSNNKHPVKRSEAAPRGSETILVTEDEGIVRKVLVRALREKGYTVLHARNGKEAVKISEEHADPIDLLLTDVIMPGMNGRDLAETIAQKRPGVTVLYMSGYDREIIAQRGVLEPGTAFIEKSFSTEGLCKKVREVLDAAKKRGPNA